MNVRQMHKYHGGASRGYSAQVFQKCSARKNQFFRFYIREHSCGCVCTMARNRLAQNERFQKLKRLVQAGGCGCDSKNGNLELWTRKGVFYIRETHTGMLRVSTCDGALRFGSYNNDETLVSVYRFSTCASQFSSTCIVLL